MSRKRPKSISITNDCSIGYDEKFCEWFKCPYCKDTDIAGDTKFCPNCGVKIRWKLIKEVEPKKPKGRHWIR